MPNVVMKKWNHCPWEIFWIVKTRIQRRQEQTVHTCYKQVLICLSFDRKKSSRIMVQTSRIKVQTSRIKVRTVRREVEKLKKKNMGRSVPLSYENGEGSEGRENGRQNS